MNVSLKPLKAAAPLLIAGAVVSGCDDVNTRTREYMRETGRTQAEYEEFVKDKDVSELQYKLDSLAYRDIFFSTKASKDSAKVAEFNEIAAKIHPKSTTISDAYKELHENLVNQNISIDDIDEIESKNSPLPRIHAADDWAYRKFFTKIGIMNDSIAEKCDKVSEQIRPFW